MFKDISIKAKLLCLLFGGILAVGTSIGILATLSCSDSLVQARIEQLWGRIEVKKKQIEDFFFERFADAEVIAQSDNVGAMVRELNRFSEQTGVSAEDEESFPVSLAEIQGIHQKHGGFFEEIIKRYDYSDLFIISREHGHVMYSVKNESDLGENLSTGPLQSSPLAKVWQKVVSSSSSAIVDMEPYGPSNNAPYIFIATPVFSNGKFSAVLAFQISIDKINSIMNERTGMGESGETYLVGGDRLYRNDHGLGSSDHTVQEAFAHPARFRRTEEYIESALQGESGVLRGPGHEGVVVHTVFNCVSFSNISWAIIAEMDESEVVADAVALRNRIIVIALVVGAMMALLITLAINKSFVRPLAVFQDGLFSFFDYLNQKRERPQAILLEGSGELATMARLVDENIDKVHSSIVEGRKQDNRMIAEIKQLFEEVKGGRLSGKLSLKAHNPELRSLRETINEMLVILSRNKQREQKEGWLKDGLNQLNKELAGDLQLQEISSRALEYICRYLEAGIGVLYLYDPDQALLQEYGSFAHVNRQEAATTFKLGEGVVGQVALEKKPILLKNIKRSQMVISSGTTSEPPVNTYTYPLFYENNLLGVMELGSHEFFDDKELQFLDGAREVIAASLLGASQNDKIRTLLQETQQANLALEDQQEELRQKNEEMAVQQQKLEESNIQMEEQQQQLQLSAQELSQSNADLVRSKNELDRRARELERATRHKSEFLANMSHELRTPLNSINLLSKMLARNKDENLSPDDIKKLQVINHSGNELLRLINTILDLSKVEAGKMTLNPGPIDTSDFLQQFVDMFETVAQEKKLQFIVEDQLKTSIHNDAEQLAQIVRNLLANSFKFTHQGQVKLTISKGDDPELPVRIAISDTGEGIPEEKQEKIFAAFTQADGSTSRKYGGTGLGLSISKEISALMGGKIRLESEEGKGSTFSILLPAEIKVAVGRSERKGDGGEAQEIAPLPAALPPTEPKEAAAPLPSEAVEDDRATISQGENPILIIEDDGVFASVLREQIQKAGFKALIALTGSDGLALAKQYKLEGILLDLGLPDMSGIEVLREIKSNLATKAIPVHIISGKEVEGVRELDVIGYLQKPVDEEQISVAIQKIIVNQQESALEVLVVEDNRIQREAV